MRKEIKKKKITIRRRERWTRSNGLVFSTFSFLFFFFLLFLLPTLLHSSFSYQFKLISDARITRRFEILIYNPLEPGRGDVNLRGIDKPSLVASTTGKGGAL